MKIIEGKEAVVRPCRKCAFRTVTAAEIHMPIECALKGVSEASVRDMAAMALQPDAIVQDMAAIVPQSDAAVQDMTASVSQVENITARSLHATVVQVVPATSEWEQMKEESMQEHHHTDGRAYRVISWCRRLVEEGGNI